MSIASSQEGEGEALLLRYRLAQLVCKINDKSAGDGQLNLIVLNRGERCCTILDLEGHYSKRSLL